MIFLWVRMVEGGGERGAREQGKGSREGSKAKGKKGEQKGGEKKGIIGRYSSEFHYKLIGKKH